MTPIDADWDLFYLRKSVSSAETAQMAFKEMIPAFYPEIPLDKKLYYAESRIRES